jgi:hypothetical protein
MVAEAFMYTLLSILCLLGFVAARILTDDYESRTGKTSYGWSIVGLADLIFVIINAVKALMLLGW